MPPQSGWALRVKEQRKPGSGVEAFRSCWQLEREKPAQRLCFGAEAEAEVLLEADGFAEACEALYRPMLTSRLS